MSPQFVRGFVETCHKQQLPAKATALLLEKEAIDRAKKGRPAFALGYDSTMDRFKAQATLSRGMQKRAMMGLVRTGLGHLGNAIGGAVGGVSRGIGNMARAYPKLTGVTVGAGGLAAFNAGSNYLTNRNRAPVIPSMDEVYGTNSAVSAARQGYGALQSKMDSGVGDGNDFMEMQKAKKRLDTLNAGHGRYTSDISRQLQTMAERMKDVDEDIAEANSDWWLIGGERAKQDKLRELYDIRSGLHRATQQYDQLNKALLNNVEGTRPAPAAPPGPPSYFQPMGQ